MAVIVVLTSGKRLAMDNANSTVIRDGYLEVNEAGPTHLVQHVVFAPGVWAYYVLPGQDEPVEVKQPTEGP